ncbi:MAG: hypothetical protein K5896_10535 [Prevotella sp.]|nr:hypothetical protein [Prevotella sp.]
MKKNNYMAPTILIVDVKSNGGLLNNGTNMKASKDYVDNSGDIGFSRGGGYNWEDDNSNSRRGGGYNWDE